MRQSPMLVKKKIGRSFYTKYIKTRSKNLPTSTPFVYRLIGIAANNQIQNKWFNLGTSGIEVTIKENFSTDYSNFIWPCSQVLGEFICAYRELFCGKSVLELGSGTGICGIITAKVGCSRVYLTDNKFDSQQSVDLCAENLQLNNVQADLLALDWGRINESKLPKVDCLIGSDCFYDEADFENLLCTISLLLMNATDPKKAKFYLAHQLRSTKHSIECLLKKWKLTCKRIPFQSQSSQSDRQVIEIYEIKSCFYD